VTEHEVRKGPINDRLSWKQIFTRNHSARSVNCESGVPFRLKSSSVDSVFAATIYTSVADKIARYSDEVRW